MSRHPPSLLWVLRDEFPRLFGTIRVLRLPAVRPSRLRFLAGRLLLQHFLVRSSLAGVLDQRGLGICSRGLPFLDDYSSQRSRISQVPGESLLQACPALRPRRAGTAITT